MLAVFGADRTPRALDRLELVEFAWHDCYDEITPPKQIIDDIPLFRHRRMSRDCDPHWRRRAGNHPHVSTLARSRYKPVLVSRAGTQLLVYAGAPKMPRGTDNEPLMRSIICRRRAWLDRSNRKAMRGRST